MQKILDAGDAFSKYRASMSKNMQRKKVVKNAVKVVYKACDNIHKAQEKVYNKMSG